MEPNPPLQVWYAPPLALPGVGPGAPHLYHCGGHGALQGQDYWVEAGENWHNPTTEQYLVFHKFGERVMMAKDKEGAMEEFKDKLHEEINPK